MTCVVLFVLFGLSCVFFPCKGQVLRPLGENNLIVLNGSNVTIAWRLDPPGLSTTNVIRTWSFKSSSGNNEILAEIGRAGTLTTSTKLYEVEIEEPATLVLKNVNASYNGKYVFTFFSTFASASEINVTIAVNPNVMIKCSDLTTVNEGDDLACECRDEEGKPQANLTWYDKDIVQIGKTSYGKNILTHTNVTKQHSGRYTCKAQSYILTDEESFRLIVRLNFKPNKTDVSFTMTPAVIGKSVTVMCSSNGLPEPSYTIMHKNKTVINQATYMINKVKSSDAGTYKCIATNKLGSDSDSKNLTVEQGQTTQPPTAPTASTSATEKGGNGTVTTPDDGEGKGGLSTGAIIGIIIGVLLLLVIIGIVVYCCKSKEKDGRNRGNIDPVPGNHYELENEEPVPGDGAYDSVGPVGASGSKSKPPAGNTLPPVYAAVDKTNRQGNTLYASLDTEALQTSRASKKEPDRPPQAEYASIDFGKTAPKADLV